MLGRGQLTRKEVWLRAVKRGVTAGISAGTQPFWEVPPQGCSGAPQDGATTGWEQHEDTWGWGTHGVGTPWGYHRTGHQEDGDNHRDVEGVPKEQECPSHGDTGIVDTPRAMGTSKAVGNSEEGLGVKPEALRNPGHSVGDNQEHWDGDTE